MKKLFSILIPLLIVAGCSAATESENKAAEEKVKTVDQAKKNVYVPNPQITDDINLLTLGETASDDKGELTLKAFKNVNKTIQIGAVEMTVQEVKIMHFVPDYSMIDFFHAYTHEEEFDFVKLKIEVKNKSSEAVQFTPVAFVKTNSGEQKTWEDEIYLEELTGDLPENDSKKGNMGFILEQTADIQSIEILTSDLVDQNGKIIEKAKNLTIEL